MLTTHDLHGNRRHITIEGASVVVLLLCCARLAFSTYSSVVAEPRGLIHPTNKLFCYYALGGSDFNGTIPAQLNATLCTHLIFIGIGVNEKLELFINNKTSDFLLKIIPVLKKINRSLKILISHASGGADLTKILATVQTTSRYVKTAASFLRKYGFDGLDLDWEFPGWEFMGQPPEQRKIFPVVLMNLQAAFKEEAKINRRPKLLLTAATCANREVMTIYNYKVMAEALDYINLMGYDFNYFIKVIGQFTGYNCPLYQQSYDKVLFKYNNLNSSALEWVKRGVPKEKMIVGVPLYCRTYTLASPRFHSHGSLALSAGKGDGSSYTLACDAIKDHNGTRVFDKDAKVPYIYYGNQWISYDDVHSLTIKIKWIMDHNFGGVMAFAMNHDDVYGHCEKGKRFPLLSAIHNTLFKGT